MPRPAATVVLLREGSCAVEASRSARVHEKQTAMVLPWDPFYRNFVGESAPQHLEYPAGLRELPSRLLAKR